MIELKTKTQEVEIILKYSENLEGVKVDILGSGDLSHHLIEELFNLVDKLALMEKMGHQASEWRKKR